MTLTVRGAGLVLAGTLACVIGAAASSTGALALGTALLLAVGLALATRPPPALTVERTLSARVTREGLHEDVVTVVRAPRAWRGGRLEVEDAAPTTWTLETGARAAVFPAGAREVTLQYAWSARTPGRHRVGPVRVRVTDPLGLVAHARTFKGADAVTVYPRVAALQAWPLTSRAALARAGDHGTGASGLGASFHAIRDYQDGDTMRDVNWRASARTGGSRLLVNERERESHAAVTLLVDARAVAREGSPDVNAWVLATRAVAHLAAGALKRRDHPRLALYGSAEDVRLVNARAGDAEGLTLVDACLDHEPRGDAGVAAAVRHVLRHLKAKSPVVIVSHFLDDASWEDAVRSLRALDQRVTVIAIQGHACRAAAGAPGDAVERAREAHAQRVAALRARGCRVIDWNPADAFPLAVLKEAST